MEKDDESALLKKQIRKLGSKTNTFIISLLYLFSVYNK
jgi:hypothetical protein